MIDAGEILYYVDKNTGNIGHIIVTCANEEIIKFGLGGKLREVPISALGTRLYRSWQDVRQAQKCKSEDEHPATSAPHPNNASLQDDKPSCDTCMLRKSEKCTAIRTSLCVDYVAIPYISQEEKERWPSRNPSGSAIQRLVNSNAKQGSYSDWEKEYLGYVIIMKEGYMYTVHNESAQVVSNLLGYKTYTSYGRVTTGGANLEKICSALEDRNYKYIAVENDTIIQRYDGNT